MQNVHSARSPSKKMNNDRREGEENLPEVTVLGGVAVVVVVKPSDSSGASSSIHCVETLVGVFSPRWFTSSILFFLLPVCFSRSPCRYPRFLVSTVSVVSLSTLLVSLSLSLSLSLSVSLLVFCRFFLSFFFLSGRYL
jgi:hypothetical protein